MTLKKYQSKRNLKNSHEPAAAKKDSNLFRFCVQKHAARQLHYDFRLEHRGVLLSWAIPKGPSLDPQDKRLAIHVEDHPLAYQYFEGTIPKGNYGAGTVEIWDCGTYAVPHATTQQEIEKKIAEGLKQGHLTFVLHGQQLNGEFVLQKLKKDPDDKNWLLIKKQDAPPKTEKLPISRKQKNKKIKVPDFIPPMLATLVSDAFDDEEWIFEIKWDGYRALAWVGQGNVQLKSRTNHLWNHAFPSIVKDLEKIQNQAILDGELVVVNSKGKSDFQLMQRYQKTGEGTLCYYVFDILYKDSEDLRGYPLSERKAILERFINHSHLPLIHFSDHLIGKGKKFFQQARKSSLEGVIGKKISSLYESKRSPNWVKIKAHLRQEVVIGGFTAPRGSRKYFGALLVGVYDKQHKLTYVGHVGGGFDRALLEEIYAELQPLIQKKSPFSSPLQANAAATWVKPNLICEVSFAEWTQENMMRQPIFQGLRVDKKPKLIEKEKAAPPPTGKEGGIRSKASGLEFTHPDKIYWPEEKYRKEDLLIYYQTVAPFIIPYLKNRPIMLHRFPNGITGVDFYQKNLGDAHPAWIKTYPIEHGGKIDHYLLINDLRSLLYAVNLGSIDLHPFLGRLQSLDSPDYCVIDLDPLEIAFESVVETIWIAHELLQKLEVKHYCKTSGGKGLHLVIPLHGKYSFEQSRQLAEIISYYIHQQLPETTSMERSPEKRKKKVYLDCLQNRFGQTLVAPYAVRPRPHALVSTPLSWKEVNKNLNPSDFNIKTIPTRLKHKEDLFKSVLKESVDIKNILKRLERFSKMNKNHLKT